MPDDWFEISPSLDPAEPHLRRADPNHPLNFWRGRDSHGRYVFQLDGTGALETVGTWPAPAGIEVHPSDLGSGRFHLRLTLVDSSNCQLFRALCITLMEATSHQDQETAHAALPIVVAQLFKWQSMLARRQSELLSLQRIIGLFGEVLFLRDELLPRLTPHLAVTTWRGPYGDEQDFLLGDVIFEIKTTLATADRRIWISSEDQLDTSSGRILLCQQNLSVSVPGNEAARSLNELVAEILGHFAPEDFAASDLFQRGLLEVGYEARPEYDSGRWALTERVAYEVTDGFPRITRAMLLPGVEQVQYRLRTEACHPFATDLNACFQELIDGNE